MPLDLETLTAEISDCDLCRDRFARTATHHAPRPVVWLSGTAKILIVGQAPGAQVHASGRPFDDPSGKRLRAWMEVDESAFYNRDLFAILPMAFCFPGYSAKGADLPPPPICAKTWQQKSRVLMPQVKLTLLVGGYAQKWHLGQRGKAGVSATTKAWQDHAPDCFPLPHPSWRNTGWLRKNPWFETELLPELRRSVQTLITEGS